jgi:hypothetical protein
MEMRKINREREYTEREGRKLPAPGSSTHHGEEMLTQPRSLQQEATRELSNPDKARSRHIKAPN